MTGRQKDSEAQVAECGFSVNHFSVLSGECVNYFQNHVDFQHGVSRPWFGVVLIKLVATVLACGVRSAA